MEVTVRSVEEYPLAVSNRAREIWLGEGQAGRPLMFADVARRINEEFTLTVTRKTVSAWSKRFAWPDSPEFAGAVQPPTAPVMAPGPGGSAPPGPVEPTDEELDEWDWEAKRIRFLAKLTNIAEECLCFTVGEDGRKQLMFKDTESRVKTGLAAVEMIGKINSGKFEQTSKDDVLPALTKNQLNQVFNYYFTPGAKEPAISPKEIIEVEFSPLPALPASAENS